MPPETLPPATSTVEVLPPDYSLAYAALARRVAAAHAYMGVGIPLAAAEELEHAMLVINQIETTAVIVRTP